MIGTDVLYNTIRFPNTRSTITITRPDGSSYEQDTSQIKMMGNDYPAYRSDGGVETYVVESLPRPEWLPNYYCSKLIYWIDKEIFCPLRIEQYDQDGKLAMVTERLERQEYAEDGRLGYTALVFLFWRTDLDLLTAGVHDYHKKMDWPADDWQTYFTPEFLRRGWFLSPYKTQADVQYPDQFLPAAFCCIGINSQTIASSDSHRFLLPGLLRKNRPVTSFLTSLIRHQLTRPSCRNLRILLLGLTADRCKKEELHNGL